MNMAVGFPCPTCGHEETNLLEIEKNEKAQPVSFRLYCMRCESVFRALREPTRGEVSSGLFRVW